MSIAIVTRLQSVRTRQQAYTAKAEACRVEVTRLLARMADNGDADNRIAQRIRTVSDTIRDYQQRALACTVETGRLQAKLS